MKDARLVGRGGRLIEIALCLMGPKFFNGG